MLTKMVFILIYLFFHSKLRRSKNKEEGKTKEIVRCNTCGERIR